MPVLLATCAFTCDAHEGRVTRGHLFNASKERAPLHVSAGRAVQVTDAAREKAQAAGVDLSGVRGSGENGRVLARDVRRHLPDDSPTADPPTDDG